MKKQSIKARKAARKAAIAAAAKVRAARDLMNHGGRHWIKGAEQMMIDPDKHEPGDQATHFMRDAVRVEPAFCSIGALKKVVADDLAIITLAEVIDPDRMNDARREATEDAQADSDSEARYGGEPWSEYDFAEYVQSQLDEVAADIIVSFNDDDRTGWDDVRSAFTAAAKRLADRARR